MKTRTFNEFSKLMRECLKSDSLISVNVACPLLLAIDTEHIGHINSRTHVWTAW